MQIHEKISLGRLREAYNLTVNEADAMIQRFWPHSVYPVDLWLKAYETCWKDFAVACCARHKIELPLLPQPPSSDNKINTFLFALDILEFFRKLSFIIPAHPLKVGLNLILEETYDNGAEVFHDERQTLFNSLLKLENADALNQYSPDSPHLESEIPAIPAAYYHFITRIFPDTILVERNASIKYLCDYPLRKEVKGITSSLVESILFPPNFSNAPLKDNQNIKIETLAVEQAEDGKLTYRIPSALWMGLPEKTAREAMAEKYPLPVIAYVLFNWCVQEKTGAKTRIGRLLADEEYSDSKSYRNLIDRLLDEAKAYHILQN